jgi:cytochrome c-type biogenesis protein CcmH/NrfG
VEAARAMAEGLLAEADATDAQRIERAFRLSLARPPAEPERELLLASIQRLRTQFGDNPEAAAAYVSVGDSKPAANIDTVEHAAYAALCLSILNTDEALTKE